MPLLLMLWCNYLKKKEIYRIVLIVIITLIASTGSILFGNGQQYYILLIALLSVLFYDLKKGVLYLSLLYAVIFIITETVSFFVQPIEPAAYYFKVINIVIFLAILIYCLYGIKKMYVEFLDEILFEKKKLEESNTLLVHQAVVLELKNKDIKHLKDQNEELSAIVYHQMRSPVVTFADLLSHYLDAPGYSREEFIDISKTLHGKVMDILHMVDNLLKWNKKGIDGITPSMAKCEVNHIVQTALAQLQLLIHQKNLRINQTKSNPLFAYADADHVLIILLNILTNAIKFSPPGDFIKIELSHIKNMCSITVTNNGKGIDEKHMKNIFSPWHIISNKGTLNESGTGLGLKICKNLIEKNNGAIRISSDGTHTTIVGIELPVAGITTVYNLDEVNLF